ncbi:hypothetical protein E2562_023466 [Oryza meyeriana var. granulata]|uniref:Leucine-rich repeat-containing N-terminal plant-type domain-containing protein n=1 Tax=Oryza meyeriana var. granulata TaxID=110450 RepID=A0A6G1FBQ3_9ORYZ|nr:hypothetical protein E2562_023466 [Oryza meyeriana var. granulata]
MQHLNLSSNGFMGDVPLAIAGLPKLKSLFLDNNRFNGSYPGTATGGLMQLETLTLATNRFEQLSACGYGAYNKLSTSTVFWMLAGVVFNCAVSILLFILRKTIWLLIIWHLKRECNNIVSTIRQEDVIVSGGSGRIQAGDKANTGKVVAMKRLWRTQSDYIKAASILESGSLDRGLHSMANHPMFCDWSRVVACICGTALMLFAFYLMTPTQLPSLSMDKYDQI